MIVRDMFYADINRSINGVVKVRQDDADVLEEEVREYVVTKELKKHFDAFFKRYVDAFDKPTADVGVWISGFFGSGKSHFLKILSCILENREINGVKTAEQFRDKFEEGSKIYEAIKNAVREPAETILFNIDAESAVKKNDSVVLRVFAKMFYRRLGFYGEDLNVVRLEQALQQEGKTEEFQRAFEKEKGKSWLEQRRFLRINRKHVVASLVKVLGVAEEDAEAQLKEEVDESYSVSNFVEDVKNYVDGKPKNFRLLFMIDEVGQYVGADVGRLLNLQTIVEELGARCGGKVWVVCTGQEAVDEIIKARENEFSRIRARFKTNLSLSSSSVDEVIQRRVLRKKENVGAELKKFYARNDSVLRNLFTFVNAKGDIKGFEDAEEFSCNFPFVPYQFVMMQKVFTEIRRHGAVGKHMSSGERSMLSGFQEAAQAIQTRDEYALVPFYRFYDSLHSSLDSSIKRSIERCQKDADAGDKIKQKDVDVLKLLYLIRYVDDIPSNLDNIVVLMADAIQVDKRLLRDRTRESLERLLDRNYIGRNDDLYNFLTDEEQDVQREINNEDFDYASMTKRVAEIIYDDMFQAGKYRYGEKDFPFARMVDSFVYGNSNAEMKLRFLTPAFDPDSKTEMALLCASMSGQAIFAPESSAWYGFLERAEKIRRYAKHSSSIQLPASKRRIVEERQNEATQLEKDARAALENAILGATVYVEGDRVKLDGSSVKAKIENALKLLVVRIYSKIELVQNNVKSDAQIREILTTKKLVDVEPDPEALDEVEAYLKLQTGRSLKTTMADVQRRFQTVPYGWRDLDVAAFVARLIRDQKVTVRSFGETIRADDPNLPNMLLRISEIGKTEVAAREKTPTAKMKQARKFLGDYFNLMDVPGDEDGLYDFIVERFSRQKEHCEELLRRYVGKKSYPGRKDVERSLELTNAVLALKRDLIALIVGIAEKADELDDDREAMQKVEDFFKYQYQIFDDAVETLDRLENEIEGGYYVNEEDAKDAIKTLRAFLRVDENFNYRNVPKFDALLTTIRGAHNRLILAKRAELREVVNQCADAVRQVAGADCDDLRERANAFFERRLRLVETTDDLTSLDGYNLATIKAKDDFCRQFEERAKKTESEVVKPKPKPAPVKKNYITKLRSIVFNARLLETEADVDAYLAEARRRLIEALKECDGVDLK